MSCYRLIDQEKAHHAVSRLARVLGVARVGYYAWARRPASARTLADQVLTEQIRDIHARSGPRPGSGRWGNLDEAIGHTTAAQSSKAMR